MIFLPTDCFACREAQLLNLSTHLKGPTTKADEAILSARDEAPHHRRVEMADLLPCIIGAAVMARTVKNTAR